LASLLSRHHDAVVHLAEIPGLGVDSAQQIIAEVGAGATTFPSAKQLSSWVGACPGEEESAEVSKSHRSPKGNRHMRRILNQAANAAAKSKGTIFELSIADWYRAWDTIRPSGPLLIGCVASSGSFSIVLCVTKSEVPR
jgi:transposase